MHAGQVVRMNSMTTIFPRWSESLKVLPSTSVKVKSAASGCVEVVVWLGGAEGVRNANQIKATTNMPIARKPKISTRLRLRFAFLRDTPLYLEEGLTRQKQAPVHGRPEYKTSQTACSSSISFVHGCT